MKNGLRFESVGAVIGDPFAADNITIKGVHAGSGCRAMDNFGNKRPAAGASCDAGATER